MEPKTEKQLKFENDKLSQNIMLSLDIESNFKLYSYRLISQETFQQRITDLLYTFNGIMQKLENENQIPEKPLMTDNNLKQA